jgi:general secretion pathway protein D
MIILDIQQAVSAAATNTFGGTTSPIISTREIKTKLAVKDGQSILIGGLIQKDVSLTETGVPLLKDIPGLGWLFKFQNDSTIRTELLVMITPYVIETEDVLDQYLNKFKEKVNGIRKEFERKEESVGRIGGSRPSEAIQTTSQ